MRRSSSTRRSSSCFKRSASSKALAARSISALRSASIWRAASAARAASRAFSCARSLASAAASIFVLKALAARSASSALTCASVLTFSTPSLFEGLKRDSSPLARLTDASATSRTLISDRSQIISFSTSSSEQRSTSTSPEMMSFANSAGMSISVVSALARQSRSVTFC